MTKSVMDDILLDAGLTIEDESDIKSVTNLDAAPTVVYVNESAESEQPEAASLSPPEEGSDGKNVKRMRFDKLGRLIDEDNIRQQDASFRPYDRQGRGGVLKRPRGRPPKGKVWHEKRGWINQGVGPSALGK